MSTGLEWPRPPLISRAGHPIASLVPARTARGRRRPDRFVPEQLAEDGIDSLPIEHAHALRVAALPAHPSDPFDRLLVAQAQLERCAFLTADAQILDYDVEVAWGGRGAPPSATQRASPPGP